VPSSDNYEQKLNNLTPRLIYGISWISAGTDLFQGPFSCFVVAGDGVHSYCTPEITKIRELSIFEAQGIKVLPLSILK
jgi:hypothetical protein